MKLNVYDDREESHSGAFKGSMSDKIIVVKEFPADTVKRFFKNENVKIGSLLTGLILMRYKG